MNINDRFSFLVNDYGLSYGFQKFTNCYQGNWTVETHSFYNNSGCFTIYELSQRDDLSFYTAPHFSTVLEELMDKQVDVCAIEPLVWKKHSKIGCFGRPFFWFSRRKILDTFAEALEIHLSKGNDLFGIFV